MLKDLNYYYIFSKLRVGLVGQAFTFQRSKQKKLERMIEFQFPITKENNHSVWWSNNPFHNWLETPKVVTFPRFLMEYPVFCMQIHNNYRKIQKRKKKIFLKLLWDSCPQSHVIANVGQITSKTLKFFSTTKYAQ